MDPSETSRRKLLVVDDDAMMRELLAAILATQGYAVHTTASGAEALDWLAQTEADVLLIDLQMPGLEGGELAARLNEVRGAQTLLIGMSGSAPRAGVRARFDAFLQKPFGLEGFRRAVQQAEAARAGTGSVQAVVEASLPTAAGTPVLNEVVYARLAAMLPAAQLRELYEISMEDALRRVELMRAAEAKGDREQCRREAHAIRGGCGMVGAVELQAMAARIEEGSFDGTPPLDDFGAACLHLRRMLDARL